MQSNDRRRGMSTSLARSLVGRKTALASRPAIPHPLMSRQSGGGATPGPVTSSDSRNVDTKTQLPETG